MSSSVTVVSGNTLWGIAESDGTSLSALEAANPQISNPNLITPGEKVNLPSGASASGSQGESTPNSVTVDYGDTLSGIAEAHGVSLSELEAANPQIQNPNLIYPGDTIHLPAGSSASGSQGSSGSSGSGTKDPSGPGPSGSPPPNEQAAINQAMQYFEGQGWTKAQSTGIVANLEAESNLDPKIWQVGGGGGYGLAQWSADRQEAYQQWSGQPITDASFQQELAFVQHELTTDYSGAGDALKAVSGNSVASAEAASNIITADYEIPADIPGDEVTRDGYAQQIFDA